MLTSCYLAAATWQTLDTKPLSNLAVVRVVVLSPSYLAFGHRGPSVAENIAGLLSVLPTSNVRDIYFLFAGNGAGQIALKPSWARVDTACMRFSELKRVLVQRTSDKPSFSSESDMQENLSYAFPMVRMKRLLRF